MTLPEHSERDARSIVRVNLGNPDARVSECKKDDCDIPFIGMTAEDYAAHLVEHHPFYRRSTRQVILQEVCKATENTE